MEEADPKKGIFPRCASRTLLWERISCQSLKTSVLADGDLWEVVVCAGHGRSRWLWASLKLGIPKQIHKYSGCGKDCRSMNIPLRANVGVRGPIPSFYLLTPSLLDMRRDDATICGAMQCIR